MNFDLDISVPVLTVFVQGLFSFFSPCVFPLVPLYIGYFSGGAGTVDEDGTIPYPRGRVLVHSACTSWVYSANPICLSGSGGCRSS